jgi:hypothetical protein
MNAAVPFAAGFYLLIGSQFISQTSPQANLDEQAPSEVAAPRRDGDPPKTGSKPSRMQRTELKEIQMTASKLLSAISIALLAAAGAAHAESYDGVHQLTSSTSRADVASQAVVAARSGNPYADGANSGPVQLIASTASRAAVRAEAVAAAHSENPYAEGVTSRVAPVLASGVDRSTVRAAARAAARGDALPL